jgi:hypothetical protein
MSRCLFAVLLGALSLSACNQRAQADLVLCQSIYSQFANSTQKAIAARNGAETLAVGNDGIINTDAADHAHQLAFAQMNLDLLLARGCCRFQETCPAIIKP